jgi:two-component system, NarL family, invasion response regulator UvrY
MVKILIADDHAVVREGLGQILIDSDDRFEVTKARNGNEVLELMRKQRFDVVVLDISMPEKNGLDLTKDLKKMYPSLPVIILSMHSEEQFGLRALRAGASGYMTKETAPEELVHAIWRVYQGGKYISPALAEKLAQDVSHSMEKLPHEKLSDREFQVLSLMATGKSMKEIAEELSLSVKTVSTYRSRIIEKTHLKTNAELISYAIQNNLV